jgi:hypothetical protein
VALIRTVVSEDRIVGIFRVHESVLIRATRCHLPETDNHQKIFYFEGSQASVCSSFSLMQEINQNKL